MTNREHDRNENERSEPTESKSTQTAGVTESEPGESTVQDLRGSIGYWRITLYAVLALLVGFFLVPIEAGLVTSFKTTEAVTRTAPYLPPGPDGFTLQNWVAAFDALSNGLVNSLLLAIPGTILSATLGSLAAYGLTQVSWRGQLPVLLLFVAAVFIPYQAVLVPLSKFWTVYVPLQELFPILAQHHATLLELIITDTAYGIPICTVLFRGYYMGLSGEMIEAAKLDGASVATIYRRIVLPLSGPMFAVTFIFQFTQIWNDLLFPLILVPGASSQAAPVTLSLVGLGETLSGTDYGLRMAGAFITALPTLLVFILFGDQFARGIAGRS